LACRVTGASMIHLSTDYVFDGALPRPYREEDVPHPLGVYGASKLQGEQYIQEKLKHYLIIRTAWLYGHHGKNFVKAILNLARDKGELRVVNDKQGSPTFTRDLSGAIGRLIEAGTEGLIHVTNSDSCTWFEFAREILHERGLGDIRVIPISSAELNRPAKRPSNSILDCSRYGRLIGEGLRPWRDALREYLSEF
jgi:dTDP-4-dehydrorhamnose reductase